MWRNRTIMFGLLLLLLPYGLVQADYPKYVSFTGTPEDANATYVVPLNHNCNSTTQCIEHAVCHQKGPFQYCSCDGGFYEYRNRCVSEKVSLGHGCDNGQQCMNSDYNSECSTGVCMCRNGYVAVGPVCRRYVVPLHRKCDNSEECIEHAFCHQLLQNCRCDDGFLEYASRCVSDMVLLGQVCVNDQQCRSTDYYGQCLLNICVCRDGYEQRGRHCTIVSDRQDIRPEILPDWPSSSSNLKTAMIILGAVVAIAVMIMGYMHCKHTMRSDEAHSFLASAHTVSSHRLTQSSPRPSPQQDESQIPPKYDEPPSYEEATNAARPP